MPFSTIPVAPMMIGITSTFLFSLALCLEIYILAHLLSGLIIIIIIIVLVTLILSGGAVAMFHQV